MKTKRLIELFVDDERGKGVSADLDHLSRVEQVWSPTNLSGFHHFGNIQIPIFVAILFQIEIQTAFCLINCTSNYSLNYI